MEIHSVDDNWIRIQLILPPEQYALLSAGTSWTAKTSDFDQNLVIDLGDVKNITRIEIQGRPHSTEYVTEFSISYGYNGLDYQDFKEPGGNTKVKKEDEV